MLLVPYLTFVSYTADDIHVMDKKSDIAKFWTDGKNCAFKWGNMHYGGECVQFGQQHFE